MVIMNHVIVDLLHTQSKTVIEDYPEIMKTILIDIESILRFTVK